MNISFFSNFLNIHQSPFCEEMIKLVGVGNFHFVATTKMDANRVEMGFENMNETKPYVIRAYNGKQEWNEALQLARDSDVVIFGSAPVEFCDERMKLNKLTFRYNERLLKKAYWRALDPRMIKMVYHKFSKYRNKNLYVLCASAYTKSDIGLYGFPRDKCYKWGYFPVIPSFENYKELEKEKKQARLDKKASLLWVARLVKLKHPELPVLMAKELKKEGYSFHLTMIGSGELENELKQMIVRDGLSECISLVGSLPHEQVINEMKKSDIFLFTSSRHEGWGAVMNEAMSCGCAVVANREIGSVPFLVQNKVNGMIYNKNSLNQLIRCVKELLDTPTSIHKYSIAAYETIVNKWNVTEASKRFVNLISSINNDLNTPYEDGPCSKA